jgi:hypothetical protein
MMILTMNLRSSLHSISHIESDCISSNNKAMQSIRNSISEMVRYNNQALLDWLQSFVPPLNKFLKAASQQTLDNEKLKTLWKDHFVNQIKTLSEKTTLLIFQREIENSMPQ